ncbi:MAG: diacylglycerol/lipid kinase family protein [Gemmatimonadaceae bacterium]
MSRTVVIVNPASGRGAGARQLGRLREQFGAHGITDIRTTNAPGDEARVVQEAVRDGAETIAVAGGDGTWGKAAVALARLGSPARIAFLANGTGNDFAKNLVIPARDHAAMAALVARGTQERRVDLGAVDDQWFLNVAGFGFDVATLITSERTRWLRGNAVYVYAALKHLLLYRGFEVQADVFGDTAPRLRMMLTVSNGLNFGGAFRIAPAARVDDGLLDFVSIGDVHRLLRLPLFAGALRGAHLAHPKVDAVRAAAATLTFDAPPDYELDGELHHAASRTVTIATVPRVLRVLDG